MPTLYGAAGDTPPLSARPPAPGPPLSARSGASAVFHAAPREELPLRTGGFGEQGSSVAVVLTVVLPWLVFLIVSLAFMLLYRFMGDVLLLLSTAATALLLAFGVVSRKHGAYDRGYVLLSCMFAVICGGLAGGYNYSIYSKNYWSYNDHWQYTNVAPDEPAAAHRDASAIVFESGSRPDGKLSISYTTGSHTYCVAPIVMSQEQDAPKIEYWAVGKDCCGGTGFTCDSASSSSAHSGLVIFNRTFAFHKLVIDDVDVYSQATMMACAKFSLVCTQQPIYVRWVSDLQSARSDWLAQAWLVWVEAGIGFLPFCLLLGLGVTATRRRKTY